MSTPEFLPLPAGFRMSEARRPKATKKELRTFQEWSDDGYKILKGFKHVGRNAKGVCLFSFEQVTKYDPVPYTGQGEDGDQDDEYLYDLPGDPNDFGHS